MIKRTITYEDYNGTERTEDFYFNFSKAEVIELELGTTGGLAETIQKIIAAKKTPELIKIFKKLILDAYGEKSADGKRFMKSDEIREAFSQTEAYSQLFTELATDSNSASAFMNGIIPKEAIPKKGELPKNLANGTAIKAVDPPGRAPSINPDGSPKV